MNFFIKFLSNRNLTYLRKLILHFTLKSQDLKILAIFMKRRRICFNQIKKNNIKNCLDVGAHVGSFSKNF